MSGDEEAMTETTGTDFQQWVDAQQERIDEQKCILDVRDGVTRRYSYLTGQLEEIA